MYREIHLDKIDDKSLEHWSSVLANCPEEFVEKFMDIHTGKELDEVTTSTVLLLTKMIGLKMHQLGKNAYCFYMNIPVIGLLSGRIYYVK